MVTVTVKSKISVQCDWNETFKYPGETAWISFKRSTGDTSVHGKLKVEGHDEQGNPYIFPTGGFTVHGVSQRTLTVSYEGNECKIVAPLCTYSTVHERKKSVRCLDVTSGGLGVSADITGKCHVWTLNNGEVRRTLSGHVADVSTCRFFPSGVVILTGSDDMQLKIWSAETAECAATFTGHKAGITASNIVDRGRNILSASRDGTVKLWDCGTQVCLATYVAEAGIINDCSLGTVGDTINLEQPDDAVSDKEVETEGKLLLLATESGNLSGFGLHSKKKVFEYKCSDAVNCCTFISDTNIVCGTQNSEIYVMDIRNTSTPLHRTKESRAAILSFQPYKQGFLTSTSDGSCFYTNEAFETSIELSGPDCDAVYNTVSDGSYVYTCCRDGFIRKYAV